MPEAFNMRRRGWVLFDVISAMILMSLMAGILAVGAHRQQVTLQYLVDSRSATRVAENVLTAMQSGQTVSADDANFSVRELSQPADIAGMSWVEVRATVSHRSASLIGLV